MNLTQLRYFKAVCVYQSVSAAAEYLHISQPSLSNAIKELESEFGVALFSRRHRGMILTEAGETLLKMSDDLLYRADRVESVMNELGGERSVLKLGVPPMIGSLILPRIYNEFASSNPDVKLEIFEGGRSELTRQLAEGFLDMAFIPHNRPIEKGFVAERVGSLEIVCCVAKDHPLSEKKEVDAEELRNIPLVLYKNGFYQTEEIKRWFVSSGVVPMILLQTEQLSTVETIISSGIAAGFLFRRLVEKNEKMVPLSVKVPLNIDISLVRKKDSYPFGCMKKFRDYISSSNTFEE